MNDAMQTPDLSEITKGIAAIQKMLGPDAVIFTPVEAKAILAVVQHSAILVEFAEYQKARSLIWAKWRSLVIGLAAIVTAIWALWDKVEPLFRPWTAK